jgi:hypothetical protein
MQHRCSRPWPDNADLHKNKKSDDGSFHVYMLSDAPPPLKVVIWDKIIEHPKDAKLLMDKATVEYGLIDQVIEKGALFVRVLLRVFAG